MSDKSLMTPNEAERRWCPFARLAHLGSDGGAPGTFYGASVNRTNENDPIAWCIAERCMAWRWFDPETREVFSVPGKPDRTKDQIKYPITGSDQSGSWVERTVKDRRGYCGLAGNP